MIVRHTGLIRLWIVLTVIWVAFGLIRATNDLVETWAATDGVTREICMGEYGHMPEETLDQCAERLGANKSPFEHERTTVLKKWMQAAAISFAIDLAITAILVGIFYVVRWVVRGFRADPAI